MTFEEAMQAMRRGKRVFRPAWNDPSKKLELLGPGGDSNLLHPFIHVTSKLNNQLPWGPGREDLLAEDWEIEPEAEEASARR